MGDSAEGKTTLLTEWESVTESDTWSEGFYYGIGLLGYALCSGWSLLMYYGPVPADGGHPLVLQQSRIAFMAVLLVSYVVLWLRSTYLNMQLTIVPALVSVPIAVVLLLLDPGAPYIQIAAWGILAIGYSCVAANWARFLATMTRHRLELNTMVTTALSGVVFVMVSYMEYIALVIVVGLTALTSGVMYFVVQRRMGLVPVIVHRAGSHRLIPLRPFMASFIYSIGMGFAGSVAIGFDSPWAPFFIGVTIIVAGLLVAIETLRFGARARLAVTKWTTAVMTVTILPMPFASTSVRFALACILLMLCFCRSIPNRQAQALRVKREGYSVGAFAFGRLANVLGALVGWLLAYIAFVSRFAASDSSVSIVAMTASVFVIFGTFVFFDYFPPEKQADERKGRCELLAEQYGLSDRQLEVMKLLAKGRDAEYIRETLVLSGHTVRSHIYAIYKKLGIHSKQELLDLIEQEGAQE